MRSFLFGKRLQLGRELELGGRLRFTGDVDGFRDYSSSHRGWSRMLPIRIGEGDRSSGEQEQKRRLGSLDRDGEV